MATHSILAWRIQGRGSLVGFHLWGCTESDMTEVTQQQRQQQQSQVLYWKSHVLGSLGPGKHDSWPPELLGPVLASHT